MSTSRLMKPWKPMGCSFPGHRVSVSDAGTCDRVRALGTASSAPWWWFSHRGGGGGGRGIREFLISLEAACSSNTSQPPGVALSSRENPVLLKDLRVLMWEWNVRMSQLLTAMLAHSWFPGPTFARMSVCDTKVVLWPAFLQPCSYSRTWNTTVAQYISEKFKSVVFAVVHHPYTNKLPWLFLQAFIILCLSLLILINL